MGIAIEKYKTQCGYGGHPSAADDFTTRPDGRIVAAQGEVFESMPLGSLGVVAFASLGNSYRQNPYTAENMRWEIGFSASRISFFSPDTSALIGGMAERPSQVTLGFYYYNELRSLSLGTVRDPGGPYVSMVFVIQATPTVSMPVGVRVHGTPENVHVFATMLAARFVEHYTLLSSGLQIDTSALGRFFEDINSFNYYTGMQTDCFITAAGNRLDIRKNTPQGDS